MATTPYRPELWLLLSDAVVASVLDHAPESGGLYDLRLDKDLPLARRADLTTIARDVGLLVNLGWRTIHLIFDGLTAEQLASVYPLVTDELDIQYHDWRESPSRVLMSLGAPDEAIVEALLVRREGGSVALELASPPALPADFRERLLAGLREWEQAAREEWEEEFDDIYGAEPIPWQELLPAPVIADTPAFPDIWQRVAKAFDDARRAVVSPIAPASAARRGLFRTTRGVQRPDIEWTRSELGYEITIAISFLGGTRPGVTFELDWRGDAPPPPLIVLAADGLPEALPLDPGPWKPYPDDGGRQWAMVTLPDPGGEIAGMLRTLASDQRAVRIEPRGDSHASSG